MYLIPYVKSKHAKARKHEQISWQLKCFCLLFFPVLVIYWFIAYDTKAPQPSQSNSPYGSLCILYYLKKTASNPCF